MKKSTKLSMRACASLLVAALVASCGTGTESRGGTERTRNAASGWTATTSPVKAVLYGTQDGLLEYAQVPGSSDVVSSISLASVPASAMGNTISMVAFDSARSQIVFGGNTPTSGVFVSRMEIDGSGQTTVYSAPTGFLYGGGYDPSSRMAVFSYNILGSLSYVMNSIDEPGSALLDKKVPFYAIPNYDGTRAIMTTGSNIREVPIIDPATTILSTSDLTKTPFDMWGFVKDPLSDVVYGARQNSGEILSSNLDGPTGTYTMVGMARNPSALAAFSDGTIVAGTGAPLNAAAPYTGELTVIDPSGVASNIVMTIKSGAASGGSIGGVQSVWAVESPIATAPPTVSVDESGNLVCSDATWRGDLPLSRLSRAPVESARTYAWFLDGKEVFPTETSETLVTAESGDISCAVVASNGAGTGYSAQSAAIAYAPPATTTVAPEVEVVTTTTLPDAEEVTTPLPSARESTTTTTSTTIEGSGGSESTPGVSPVVTVPTAAPGEIVGVVTPALRSAKWTFKGRTVKVTFRKWSGARKYRLSITGATRKTITCKTAKTTVTCTTVTLKKGINSFTAKALSTSGITLALSSKTRITK